MDLQERLSVFLNSYHRGNTAFLDELEKEALADDVPIIRKETQDCMKLLLSMKKPRRILEVGAAVGFSAIFMQTYNPVDCELVTIENYQKRIPIARENIRRAGLEHRITLLEGDAACVLKTLSEPFDFIFMDAAKAQYINFLPEVLRLLNTDGVLVSDNILMDGDILESKYVVIRRNRTIHRRMRSYLYEITHHEQLVTAILPVGDGITVSTKV